MRAVLQPTTPRTAAVLCEPSVAASRVEQTSISTVVRSGTSRSLRSTGSNLRSESVGIGDVTEVERKSVAEEVRQKFDDVFKVSESECIVLEESFLSQVKECNVAARLSSPSAIAFFEKVGAPEFILKVLREGHFPKFKSFVPPLYRKNNASFFRHNEWAVKEVRNMIESDRVEVVEKRPYCVLPLHVVIQPKKNRLVLDCGILNDYVVAPKFKLDDYKVALNYFTERGWLLVFDFKDGYYHVRLHDDFKTYVGFELELDGKLTYCQFKVGFLGLVDMPWLFTKIFRVLVKHWRSVNIPCCLYLDDGWVFSKDYEEACKRSRHIRSDLWECGVVWSIKKCVWSPKRMVEWLGMSWNADELTLRITETRITKLRRAGESIMASGEVSVRELASWVGQVISLGPVMGSVTRLRSRYAQMVIASSSSYDNTVGVSSMVMKELLFWKENVDGLNCRSCKPGESPVVLEVRGDAWASGCGSFAVGEALKTARLFSEEEREAHSTWRELENVRFSLVAMKERLRNRSVNFLIDNQSAVSIVKNGSMKEDCHELALNIHQVCASSGIALSVQWIPRSANEEADALSRLAEEVDTDDWGLTQEFFSLLSARWGPYTVDCFANFYNAKVEKFYSFFLTPGTAGVDAFTFDWKGENCLLVPPVVIVGRVLNHLLVCKAKGTLVVPLWKSAHFWPMLLGPFRPFIRDVITVKAAKVLKQGRNKNSLMGSAELSSMVLGLLIDCSSPTGF